MPDLEQAITLHLNTGGLGGLAGTPPRVYNTKAAQLSLLPYIVFTELTVVRRHAMGLDAGVLETPVRFTTRANTLAEARAVDAAIRSLLSRMRAVVFGIEIQDTLVEGTEPDFDPDLGVFEVSTDITFWHVGS